MSENLEKYLKHFAQAAGKALDVMDSVASDPYLQAGARMGLDEISHALKAFPDSIPITPEMGGIGEPTPQEVFADRQGVESPLEAYQRDMYTPKLEPEKEIEK